MNKGRLGVLGVGALIGALVMFAGREKVSAQQDPPPPQGLVVGFDASTQTYLRWDMSTIAWVEFTTPRASPGGRPASETSELKIFLKTGQQVAYRGSGAFTLGQSILSHWRVPPAPHP